MENKFKIGDYCLGIARSDYIFFKIIAIDSSSFFENKIKPLIDINNPFQDSTFEYCPAEYSYKCNIFMVKLLTKVYKIELDKS